MGARDLRWRARRFLIAVLGTALVFAVTLQLSGFRATFDVETSRFIDGFGAAAYVVQSRSEGPFSASAPVPSTLADDLVAVGAVTQADPVLTARQPVTAPRRVMTYIIGHRPGGFGTPAVTEGRAPAGPGEAAIDVSAGFALGEVIELGGSTFTVTGLVEGRTIYLGLPIVFVPIADVQAAAFGGQALATTVLVDRLDPALPEGYRAVAAADAEADVKRLLESAATVLTILRFFLWAVAAAVIGSILYVSVLERTRDLAVFKATGVGNGVLALALALQAVILALTAAVAAATIAVVSRPVFPIEITLPLSMMGSLGGVAVLVGLLSTVVALRRIVSVEPVAAFRGP